MSDTPTTAAPLRVSATQSRTATFDATAARADGDARIPVVVSTDAPVEMHDGVEVLVHSRDAVDLSRAPLPIIVTHRGNQINVGLVEDLTPAGGQMRGMARFGKRAEAQDYQMDVESGVIRAVSVGYRRLQGRMRADGVMETTRWQPTHVALVAEPADIGAGFYRGDQAQPEHITLAVEAAPIPAEAPAAGRSLAAEAPTAQPEETPMSDTATAAPAAQQQPDIRVIESTARAAERARQAEIRAIGRAHGMEAQAEAAADGDMSIDAFRAAVLNELKQRGTLRDAPASPEIGLTDKEVRNFSITRLMYALLEPNDKAAQRAAGLEIEASVAARRLQPIDEQSHWGTHRSAGYTVPYDVLSRGMVHAQRDLTVGTATAGGNLVATNLDAASFIELLRNRMVMAGLGARMLPGLVGNLAIPSQTSGASVYWVTETNAVTESQLAVGQVAMSPKTIGTYTDYSRRTLLQTTPAIENLVRADLTASLAHGIDAASISGTGSSGQPTGILNTSGIGAVAIGTNGGAPTYNHMVALEEQIGIANADVASMAYLTNAKMRAQLKLTQVFSSTDGTPVWMGNEVNGYRAEVTNAVPSNLTKGASSGVCSAIVLGNWSDLLIGMWGGLDLILDPYTAATSGGRRIVALQDVDVAVRRAASFAAIQDALRT